MTTENQLLRTIRDTLPHIGGNAASVQSLLSSIDAHLSAPAQPASGEAVAPERVAWAPYLVDRADGVKGHYAIGRWNPRGYREVWNLHLHRWAAYSDDVMSLEEADSLLRQIVIPTVRTTPPASQEQAQSSFSGFIQTVGSEPKGLDWSEVGNSAAPCPQCTMTGQHKMGCSYGHPGGAALHAHNATPQGQQPAPSYAQPSGKVVAEVVYDPDQRCLYVDLLVPLLDGTKLYTAPQPAQAARVAMTDAGPDVALLPCGERSDNKDMSGCLGMGKAVCDICTHGITSNGATDPTTP